MKARMSFGQVSIEAEGTAKEVFTELAGAAEVFGHYACGKCGSEHVVPVVRDDKDGNTYYEMKCKDCGHALSFGQRRADGKLFPRRKDKSDQWLPNGGWVDNRPKPAQPAAEPF